MVVLNGKGVGRKTQDEEKLKQRWMKVDVWVGKLTTKLTLSDISHILFVCVTFQNSSISDALQYNGNYFGCTQQHTQAGNARFAINFPKWKKGGYSVRKIMQAPKYGKKEKASATTTPYFRWAITPIHIGKTAVCSICYG